MIKKTLTLYLILVVSFTTPRQSRAIDPATIALATLAVEVIGVGISAYSVFFKGNDDPLSSASKQMEEVVQRQVNA